MSVPNPNVRLALEQMDRQPDGMGGFTVSWRRLGWIWAEMVARTPRDTGSTLAIGPAVRWHILTRAARAGDPRRPVPGQRLRHGQRLFRIDAVAETDRAGHWLTIHAQEETKP
ncbi:head-tail adaptor protein [Paracoccus sp. (in: a-proteobacteria)]|uniref:head-tail adaptor protein n=1 Tax=Paracoccus sp. TaxID=267 RepID=UPI0026E0D06C|nr:head-tail adaptor protein [Paracoccus sp. (in: a-proteobacteria)]MDO5647983.1 head-tail adaptor protein [Paracoccus sp. (in: a-proteobacteria)]